MTSRRTLAWGLVAVTAWGALAAISGAWSPLARRPLLDGLIPGAAYRWVEPPPELAPENEAPRPGSFEIGFRGRRSEPDVVFTPDDQTTLIAPEGLVVDADARALLLEVTPLAPSGFAPLPGELEPFGNVVRIDATVEPGGAVRAFDEPATAILVYPATPDLHATSHVLLWSADGGSWTELDTMDSVAQQQAEAAIDGPGLLVVGGVPSPIPVPPPVEGSNDTLSTILLVVAGASLLIGIGLLVRARGAER